MCINSYYTIQPPTKNTLLELEVELKSHFFFLSWVHRGQNLSFRTDKGKRCYKWKKTINATVRIIWQLTQYWPFSFGFGGKVDTRKMKPLDRTLENETQDNYEEQVDTDDLKITEELSTYIWVITSNHLSIGHLMTQAVGGLIGVNRHVQNVRRLHGQQGIT